MNKSKIVKILLIEDNPGDARLIQEMVSGADGAAFDLEHVDRLSTGLKHLVAAGDIDLVLLDLGLPDSSGFDTFTIVQAQAPGVAIVVLTGFEDKTIENKALQAGAQDYLSKNQLDSNSLMRSMRYAIERKKTEKRIEHLNSVLKAIRNVNQLVLVEKDRDSLLQKACDALIETRAYNAAWLGFLQDDETFATVVGSGFSENVSRFCRHVMNGDHPPCIKKALAQKDHLIVLDKSRECGDCFFKDACVSKDAAIIRVEHADRFFGLLAVLFAPDVTVDDEEKELLQEVAGDIGLALHNMELEESRRQAEEELAKHRDHLEELVKERTCDLEAAQEELIKRERLSVLGQLTATVSHEIRNPLGVIRSSAFYLQRKLGHADEKITKHLNRVEKQVDLCDSIVDELLEYTRGRHSEAIQGEINPWLEKVLDEITIPENVALVSECSPDLPLVRFDRDKMHRVVFNLVNNALQAVTARHDSLNEKQGPYQPKVKVSTSVADNGIRIEVEDNGIGMNDKTAGRAFEPLFTTSARGTGLGLAIVRKIVEEHGGHVSLDSTPNRGTKVTLVIPAGT